MILLGVCLTRLCQECPLRGQGTPLTTFQPLTLTDYLIQLKSLIPWKPLQLLTLYFNLWQSSKILIQIHRGSWNKTFARVYVLQVTPSEKLFSAYFNDAVVKSPKTVSFRAKRKILLKQSHSYHWDFFLQSKWLWGFQTYYKTVI